MRRSVDPPASQGQVEGSRSSPPSDAEGDGLESGSATPAQPTAETQGVAPVAARDEAVYLGRYSADDVQRAVARRVEPGAELSWRVRPWSARADTLVVLSFVTLQDGRHVERARPELVVLEKREAGLQVVAKGDVPMRHDDCQCEDEPACGDPPKWELDLARYTIAPRQDAIGVRFTCHHAAATMEDEVTSLSLLVPDAGSVREVFSSLMDSVQTDRPCACVRERHSTLHILSSQNEGFYDLVLRSNTRVKPFFEDSVLSEPAEQRTTRRFGWNSHQYTAPSGP